MPAQRMRSVIPPYMLRRIIEHGNAPQRDCALLTLNHVQSLLGNKPLRSPTEKNARAGEALRDIYDAQNGTQLPGKQVRKEGPAQQPRRGGGRSLRLSRRHLRFLLAGLPPQFTG